LLHGAARAGIGDDRIHTAHKLRDFAQDSNGVIATFRRRDDSSVETVTAHGVGLIAADGIHSIVRRTYYPDEGSPTGTA
jgi:2-polyprenyl-6-methoxyphenol hydroxylase-like FAD-dependent oxidoreductase